MHRGVKLGFGIPLLLLGLVATALGVAAVAFIGADGEFTSPQFAVSAPAVAIVADSIEVADVSEDRLSEVDAAVGVDLHGTRGPIFVGVARADDAAAYLRGATIAKVAHFDVLSSRLRTVIEGTRGHVSPPGDQDFWVASTVGRDRVSLSWRLRPGEYWLVLMNADGSRGIDASGRASIDIPILGAGSIAVLLIGLVLLGAGLGLTISAVRSPARRPGPGISEPPSARPPEPTPAPTTAPTTERQPAPPRPDRD